MLLIRFVYFPCYDSIDQGIRKRQEHEDKENYRIWRHWKIRVKGKLEM